MLGRERCDVSIEMDDAATLQETNTWPHCPLRLSQEYLLHPCYTPTPHPVINNTTMRGREGTEIFQQRDAWEANGMNRQQAVTN